jgi:HK97 family phage portal protein
MNLRDRVLGRGEQAERLTLADMADVFSYNGNWYPLNTTYQSGPEESPPSDYGGYVRLFKTNPIAFACIATRVSLFSEARFAFRRYRDGRPGDLFGNRDLAILESPDFNVTTGGLLTRMELDASLAGNAYNVRPFGQDRIVRLKPQYVTIMLGTPNADVENPADDPEVEVVAYVYDPKRGEKPKVFLPGEVSHFAPLKDPEATFRGMSWLTPVIREVTADDQATDFKKQFFRNGATVNLAVTMDKEVTFDKFEKFKAAFNEEHQGAMNAYKTLFLGGGADAKVIGSNFEEMAYTAVQKAGENRICIASGVPAVIAGLQSGLDAATYSNMGQARRVLADGTARPWWREASASLEPLVTVPSDARLDVDVDDIAFLRDDGKDIAEIQLGQAGAIKALTEAGYTAESVVDAVTANDLKRLKHSGMTSVQLLPPGTQKSNGNGAQTQPANA